MAETFRTGKVSGEEIVDIIRKNFDLTPKAIIEKLDLRKPIFRETAAYGHFGRDQFSWEKLDMVNKLS
jgi:S-adenosylmethionine synthetase